MVLFPIFWSDFLLETTIKHRLMDFYCFPNSTQFVEFSTGVPPIIVMKHFKDSQERSIPSAKVHITANIISHCSILYCFFIIQLSQSNFWNYTFLFLGFIWAKNFVREYMFYKVWKKFESEWVWKLVDVVIQPVGGDSSDSSSNQRLAEGFDVVASLPPKQTRACPQTHQEKLL